MIPRNIWLWEETLAGFDFFGGMQYILSMELAFNGRTALADQELAMGRKGIGVSKASLGNGMDESHDWFFDVCYWLMAAEWQESGICV